jgi:hypothetical protein
MLAIIDQIDRFLDSSTIDRQFGRAAFQPVGILDGDFVSR